MEGVWSARLIEWVWSQAIGAGFDLAGVAPAHASPDATPERFAEWIDLGRAGEMEYLKRRDDSGKLLRSAVQVAIPWARSVVVCAFNYNAAAPRSVDPAANDTGWIGRYAWSGSETGEPMDYHDDLMRRLRMVEAALLMRAECETRCYVDTGPLLERDLAEKAGIGWIGKNTCVINQEMGSWLLLGVIVTSLPMEMALELAPDRCGSCTRCIDACPTDALVGERQMDASLCIAYLTIEKKGAIAEELREPMGRQVFGCDICQDVCPWNRKAPIAVKDGFVARAELVNPPLAWLAGMDEASFRQRFRGSPLERTKRKRLHRNVAIAMGNSGEGKFLPILGEWAESEDVVLADAAGWAIKRIARLAERV